MSQSPEHNVELDNSRSRAIELMRKIKDIDYLNGLAVMMERKINRSYYPRLVKR